MSFLPAVISPAPVFSQDLTQAYFEMAPMYVFTTDGNSVDNSAEDFKLNWKLRIANQSPTTISHLAISAV